MMSFKEFFDNFGDGFGSETVKAFMELDPDGRYFKEVTPLSEGAMVTWYDGDSGNYKAGTIAEITDDEWATVEEDDGTEWEVRLDECEADTVNQEEIPAYFWHGKCGDLQVWLDSEEGRKAAVNAGFRVWDTPDDIQISRDCTDMSMNKDAFKRLYEFYKD